MEKTFNEIKLSIEVFTKISESSEEIIRKINDSLGEIPDIEMQSNQGRGNIKEDKRKKMIYKKLIKEDTT